MLNAYLFIVGVVDASFVCTCPTDEYEVIMAAHTHRLRYVCVVVSKRETF